MFTFHFHPLHVSWPFCRHYLRRCPLLPILRTCYSFLIGILKLKVGYRQNDIWGSEASVAGCFKMQNRTETGTAIEQGYVTDEVRERLEGELVMPRAVL